jgi:polyhydroxyalkanoate synthesis regulator phasin
MSSYPNMSYCMFQNTREAMQQLLSAMEEEGGHLLADMSRDELRAFNDLYNQCEAFVELANQVQQDFEEMEQDNQVAEHCELPAELG